MIWNVVKQTILLSLIAVTLVSTTTACDKGEPIAIVGGEEIVKRDYNNSLNGDEDTTASDYALYGLIEKKILLQDFISRGVELNDAFEKDLSEIHYEDLREAHKNSVVEEIEVFDEEIENYYVNNRDLVDELTEVSVRYILIKTKVEERDRDNYSGSLAYGDIFANFSASDRARSEAQSINANNFNDKFEKYSNMLLDNSESSKIGRDLGYFKRSEVPSELINSRDTIFKMNVGETSDLMDTSNGYLVIRLDDKRNGIEDLRQEIGGRIKAIKYSHMLIELINNAEIEILMDTKRSLGDYLKSMRPDDYEYFNLYTNSKSFNFSSNLSSEDSFIDNVSEEEEENTLDDQGFTDSSYFEFDSNLGEITDYSEFGPKDVVIPKEINGFAVNSIGDGAFIYKQLSSVVIPDSVTYIGRGSFGQNNLTSLKIPDSVNAIANSAFTENNISELYLSKSIKGIGNYAFCDNMLTTLDIPSSVETIGESAFILNNLTSVNIPNSVKEIDQMAFYDNNLTRVVVPSHTSVWDNSFDSNVEVVKN